MKFYKNCKPQGTYKSWKNWLSDCYNRDEFLAEHFPNEYKVDNAT